MPETLRFGGELPPKETLPFERLEAWSNGDYTIDRYGDNFSVVLLGETHHVQAQALKQCELIEIIRPEFILEEGLSGWLYEPATGKFAKQAARRFNEKDLETEQGGFPFVLPEVMLNLADEIGCKIIGCDATSAELQLAAEQMAKNDPDKYRFDPVTGDAILVKSGRRLDIKGYNPFREKMIAQQAEIYQALSRKPLPVIIGANHSRRIHQNGLLQNKGFDYAAVRPKPDAEKRYEVSG